MTTRRRRRGPSRVAQMVSKMNPDQITREELDDNERRLLTGFVQESVGAKNIFIPPAWKATDGRSKRRRRT